MNGMAPSLDYGRGGSLPLMRDYACPLCYMALGEWDELDDVPNVVRPVSALLLPGLPVNGLDVERYDRLRGIAFQTRERNDAFLTAQAARLGLPWVQRQKIACSRPAHVFSKWADAEQLDPLIVDRTIFEAYFGRGEDIGSTVVLQRVAEVLGLPARKVPAMLEDESMRREFEDDLAAQAALMALKRLARPAASLAPAHVADAERTRMLEDWAEAPADTLDWFHLRATRVPERYERTALSLGMKIIDYWDDGASPWPQRMPSSAKFYAFVALAPLVTD